MNLLEQLPHIELGPRAIEIPLSLDSTHCDHYDPNRTRREHVLERWKGNDGEPIEADQLLWWHKALKPFRNSGIEMGEACSVSLSEHRIQKYIDGPKPKALTDITVDPSLVCGKCGEHIWLRRDGFILCTRGTIR